MKDFRFSAKLTLHLLFLLPVIVAGNVRATSASNTNLPTAAVFVGGDSNLAREISGELRSAGYVIENIGEDDLKTSARLRSSNFDLLVLPHARELPAASMTPVGDYLRGGGRLMALGLPAWEFPTFSVHGKSISTAEYEGILEAVTADQKIVDFAREDMAKWVRSNDDPRTRTQVDSLTHENQGAIHVTVDNLEGWSVLLTPPLANPFPNGQTLTCFQARGSSNTTEMSIEWNERDGSRWIAVIDLAPQWKSYALPPEAFHPWESTPGRGGPGDCFHVENAARLSIGLARSHAALPGPHHEYWISNIGAARSPLGNSPGPEIFLASQIDTLSPAWKFYPMNGPLKLSMPKDLALASPAKLQISTSAQELPQAMQPRPREIGFNQERPWRWQPLLEAHSPEGDYRGALATLLIHFDDEFRRGVWACFTPDDDAFYRQKQVRRLLRETAAAMRRGLFLQEGGSEFFTVFEGQKFLLGARAINLSGNEQTNLALRIRVDPKNGGKPIFVREWPLKLEAGAVRAEQESWQPVEWPDGGFIVTTELIQAGRLIDRLEHELNVWRPKSNPQFIEEHDGQFWLAGRPWKINGVNYMPSTGIGVSGGNYFENWLGKGAYDPEAIERDLRRVKAMNLNAVSVFIDHSELPAQHLLDLLRRCEGLGLHVNQSLRPGTPLDFQWEMMRDLITHYRMAENDTIFAYDLAWEPEHRDEQNAYGHGWAAWVANRYGNAANAERAWGVPAPRLNGSGELAVPPGNDLAQDGAWRVLAADYRSFLDSVLAQKYGEARSLVRSIDPHHAVSFRMSEAGDPTFNSDRRLPFDFYGLARAIDIWEPEAYGRIGDWDRVRGGRFTEDYARLCDPNKPFIWAEMGYTVWDDLHGKPSPDKMEFAADYFRNFYRMMTEAGCDGVFFWWYPGGYRMNEQSDFGIINPDGTDRPVSRIIREQGRQFLTAPRPPAPDYFLTVDRDRDARGLFGIYQAVKKDYWQAITDGKAPALKWAKEPGKK